MDTTRYLETAQATSKLFTKSYSTSFSLASRLFDPVIRPAVYAIYGMTRVADEIVDTYRGSLAAQLSDDFEAEVYQAIEKNYSTNPILHAFQDAANRYGITADLIEPFFTSMRMDLTPTKMTEANYDKYIYGSASVVGLMCLKIFTNRQHDEYERLALSASKLGAAYQKVNFLRDLHEDVTQLGRYYFPVGTYKTFSETTKQVILADIYDDFAVAKPGIDQLPDGAKRAVKVSYAYFFTLCKKLATTNAVTIKNERIRISDFHKLLLYAFPGVTLHG